MVLSRAMNDAAASQVERFRQVFARVQDEIGRMMVGQREIIEGVLVAFFSGGHVLLEGVPGLGKTTLLRTLARPGCSRSAARRHAFAGGLRRIP